MNEKGENMNKGDIVKVSKLVFFEYLSQREVENGEQDGPPRGEIAAKPDYTASGKDGCTKVAVTIKMDEPQDYIFLGYRTRFVGVYESAQPDGYGDTEPPSLIYRKGIKVCVVAEPNGDRFNGVAEALPEDVTPR